MKAHDLTAVNCNGVRSFSLKAVLLVAISVAARGQSAVDRHAEAIKFRLLQLRDERGQIPPNAWVRAAEQSKQMRVDPKVWPTARPVRLLNAGIQPSAWTWLGPGIWLTVQPGRKP